MYFVEHGEVVLQRLSTEGAVSVFQRAVTGDALAEASAYAERYHCDALALRPTILLEVPRRTFLASLASHAQSGATWSAHLARAVQRSRLQSEIRGLRKVSDRLDAWIAQYGDPYARDSLQGIAAEIAVTREALYRELSRRKA